MFNFRLNGDSILRGPSNSRFVGFTYNIGYIICMLDYTKYRFLRDVMMSDLELEQGQLEDEAAP